MKVYSISRNIARFSLTAAAASAGLFCNSCYYKDERYTTNHNQEIQNEYIEENPLKIFNNFATDIGLLNSPNSIEKIGTVKAESSNGDKIYCVYEKYLNLNNRDTLALKQITVYHDNTISADTFLMYFNLGKLQIENKSKGIKNVSLQKDTYKNWNEFRDNKFSAVWYKIDEDRFTRDTGKKADIYYNTSVTSPPEGY